MNKIFSVLLITFLFSNISFSQNILWEEKFDSINILSRGWSLINNDSSASLPGFFTPFHFVNLGDQNSQDGNYFFKFSFDDANYKNIADDWLITPKFNNINKGDSISFWCGAIDINFKDSLKIWISETDNQLSSFTLMDYFKVDGPAGTWHKKSYDLSDYAGKNIFFAVNYYIKDGGPLGGSSDNLWIDHFVQTGRGYGIVEPATYELRQNFPNPFNPQTDITFRVPGKSNVTIKIYNTLGKEILTLVDGVFEQGKYIVSVDGTNLPSGAYFYKMTAGSFSETKKMELIK